MGQNPIQARYLVILSRNFSFSMRTAWIASHIVIFSKQSKQRISRLARFSVRINRCFTVYIICFSYHEWKIKFIWNKNLFMYLWRSSIFINSIFDKMTLSAMKYWALERNVLSIVLTKNVYTMRDKLTPATTLLAKRREIRQQIAFEK